MNFIIALCSCVWLCQTLASGAAVKAPNLSIVGGDPTTIQLYPWQIQIVNASTGDHLCGGSILSKFYIISAAHCFADNGADDINIIRAGITDISAGGGFESEIDTVTIHPYYNKFAKFEFDIALIKLTTPMTFNKNMTPITLAGRGETVDEGTLCNATGWGDLVEDQAEDFPTILQVVSLPLVSRGICNEAVGGITDAMICAGFEEGGKDSCQGDSGGPLVCPTSKGVKLFGVVSWGNGCGREGQYGVYAEIGALGIRSWIKSFTGV